MFRLLVVPHNHFQGIECFHSTSRVFRGPMVHRFQVLRIQIDVRSSHTDCAASAHGTNSALVEVPTPDASQRPAGP